MGEATAIEASREQRKKLMAKILAAPIPEAAKLLDPAALVREDRDRWIAGNKRRSISENMRRDGSGVRTLSG